MAKPTEDNRGGRRRAEPLGVDVRRLPGRPAWVLVHPRCAHERAEDLEEVDAMIEAGAIDVAVDELRWLLSGCSEFIEAHKRLGELALSQQNDVPLARGHFGIAYELGRSALLRRGMPAPLPYQLEPNQPFFEAGKGLAWCLCQLDKRQLAGEVLEFLLRCDPGDPLALRTMFKK